MKQSKEMDRIQADMARGVITRDGFLGSDRRLLVEILDEDEAAVKRLGLTHAALGTAMGRFRDAGSKGLGQAIKVEPHFEISVDGVRGKLPCPFGGKGLHQKSNIRVCNLASGREVLYTDLNIHMVSEHGFYEGKGAAYRLDPTHLAATLEVSADDA